MKSKLLTQQFLSEGHVLSEGTVEILSSHIKLDYTLYS